MDSKDSPDTTSLFSSAKTVADAAQSAFRRDPAGFDKAKTADAAADLLDAGSRYAKVDESSGYGKYVDKAEDYLRQYGGGGGKPVDKPAADAEEDAKKPADTSSEEEEEGKKEEGGGGVGGYMKMAEGLMGQSNSNKSESEGEGGGGVGDIMKMAQGFIK